MSDVFYAAFTVTTLLGSILLLAYAWRRKDDIIQTLENLTSRASDNILQLLALSFLVSLAITGLAGVGLI